MANKTYGDYIYGVRDAKVAAAGSTTAIDANAVQTISFEFVYSTAELMGDDVVKASVSLPTKATATVGVGALSDELLETITGETFTAAGTTPNETNTLQIDAGTRMPYFQLKAQAYDDDGGAVVIFFPQCKVIGGMNLEFANGSWLAQEIELELTDDGTNGIVQIVQQETAAALSFS